MTWRETDSCGVVHTPMLVQETLLQIASEYVNN